MSKKLEELTVEEWGAIFPIEMHEHNPKWAAIFELEKNKIEQKLGTTLVLRTEHFGSSSIPKLKSKDIIDILIEIPTEFLFNDSLIEKMKALDYEFFRQPGIGPDYMIFVKGFLTNGKKAQKFFVHMTQGNHIEMWERIYFRDYLRINSDLAHQYENLKCELVKKHSKNRIDYRIGKTAFVKKITELAKNSLKE